MRLAFVFRSPIRNAVLACALLGVPACGYAEDDPLATLSSDELIELCQGYRAEATHLCVVRTTGAEHYAIFSDHAECRFLMTGCPATVAQFRSCMALPACSRKGDPRCAGVYACLPPGR